MDTLLQLVGEAQAELDNIRTEVQEAQEKGVFSYGRSKNIRKAALDLARKAKDLRVSALEAFKSHKGK